MGYMSAANYKRLMERDGGHCVHCGATEGLVPQHRQNRGMGGSLVREQPSNIVTLCSRFNGEIESDAAKADLARDMGWKLRLGTMPEAKALYDMVTRRWYYLDNEWNRKDAFDVH